MAAGDFFLMILDYIQRVPYVILSAAFLACAYAKHRKYFALRAVPAICLYCVAGTLLLVYQNLFAVGGWFSFAYAIIFFLAVLVVWFCFDIRFERALFCSLAAYVFQNMFFYFRALLDYLFPGGRTAAYFAASLAILLALEAVFFFVFVRHFRRIDETPRRPRVILIYSGFVVLIVYVMHSWASYAGDFNFSFDIFGILLNLMLLVVQFDMFERSRLIRDNETVERMLKMSEQQQIMSEANVDVINRKCHDLKYQIAAIRTSGWKERDIASELSELENSVNIYDHIAQTGNKVLDVVLTEKKLYCSTHRIKFSYIVDPQGLNVITSSVDLYSLFGNLIDNAIESVKDLEEDKRIITLNVGAEREILRIHTDNWCEEKVEFADGLPVTKKDRRYHGFGVKSVRYIAEKYGGNVVMRQEEDRFCADILIPIRSASQTD